MRTSIGRLGRVPRAVTVALAIAVTSVVLTASSPVAAMFVMHDDELYLSIAESLRSRDWLGPYHALTLAKVPGYSMFLAVTSLLHIPVRLAEHAVYLAGSGLMALVLYRLTANRAAGYVMFAVAALNP